MYLLIFLYFKKIITVFAMLNTVNQKIQADTTRALAVENNLSNVDVNLAISIVFERERATAIEASLATSVAAERERVGTIEASLATNALLNKADSSNAVMQANNKLLEMTNYVSNAMTQNKIDNSNAIFQITTTLINSQSTAIATQSQIKLDASNAMVASKSASDSSLSQIKFENSIALAVSESKSDATLLQIASTMIQSQTVNNATQAQIKLENSIALAVAKNASDTTLSQIKMESSTAAAQMNISLAQSRFEASNAQWQLAMSLRNDITVLNTSVIAVDGKFGFLLASCPNNSNGVGVATGCTCNTGFIGFVTPTIVSPFYKSTCALCPVDSFSPTPGPGCTCKPGFSGNVTPTNISPFYTTTCSPVACPFDSIGMVFTGCKCSDLRAAAVAPTITSPFYATASNNCPFLSEIKSTGAFTWTAPVAGILSIIAVAGGGSGGKSFKKSIDWIIAYLISRNCITLTKHLFFSLCDYLVFTLFIFYIKFICIFLLIHIIL